MALRILSDLIGTLQDYLLINTIQVKNDSGVAAFRDEDDTEYRHIAASGIHMYAGNADITHQPNVTASGVTVYNWPTDGSSGQVIQTDGAGNLSFTDFAGNGEYLHEEAFTQATSSPLTIFTPPANSIITQVQIEITVAAANNSPDLEVGVASDPDRDMTAAQVKENKVATYTVKPNTSVGASPEAEILTITPAGETFSGEVRVWYSIPA